MKNVLSLKLALSALVVSQVSWATAPNPVIGSVAVQDKRASAVSTFRNILPKEVYCENIQFHFEVVGDEFGEPLGKFTQVVDPLYLQPEQEVTVENLGAEVKKFSTSNRVAIISDVESDFSSCREVGFVDYCKHAEKNKDESYTLSKVFEAAKTGRCEEVEVNLKGKLKLNEKGIFNLKPISYLKSLIELQLSENNVADVSVLSTLERLEKVDVSRNPLKEIDTLVSLPNMEVINASETDLEYKVWKNVSKRLKKVRAYKTPYETVYREKKNKS